jgi:Magnesium chelatase, subunit ChlI
MGRLLALGARTVLVTTRPCRAPPQTISDVGLIGGGHVPMPGDVFLAYHGVRFLDQRPECRCHVLEVVHQLLAKDITRIPLHGRLQSHRSCGLGDAGDSCEGVGQGPVARYRAGGFPPK